jgi:hypothetical protein
MTYEGIFDDVKLHDEIKKLKQLIKEKNSYIRLQDKEIDTLKGQIDLKDLEIEMLKKNDKNIAR